MEANKKMDIHLFQGNATTYWWTGHNWRIQSRHKECIRHLYKELYKKTYKPMVANETIVFSVTDKNFSRIHKVMTEAYKSVVVAIEAVA